MLSERLQAAINNAAQLPPEIQDQVAAQLESAITNALWDADLGDPQNDTWLSEWIEDARQDETVDFPSPHAEGASGKVDSGARNRVSNERFGSSSTISRPKFRSRHTKPMRTSSAIHFPPD